MKKKDLINWVCEETNMSVKDSTIFIEKMFSQITESLKEEELQLPFIGKFSVVETKAKKGRNPQTGETIEIPASKKIKFKVSKEWQESIK